MPEVALFGGSFDPPHVGHLLAAAYVLATEPVDELIGRSIGRYRITRLLGAGGITPVVAHIVPLAQAEHYNVYTVRRDC